MKMSKVGNQTNSQDPQAVNSRVFVGNLNTFQCSKTDVERMFQRYGRLAGISMHKGYAFVQFTNPFDARSACLGENGRNILSQVLDVNMVAEPKPHQIGRKLQNSAKNGNDWDYYYDTYYASTPFTPGPPQLVRPLKRPRLNSISSRTNKTNSTVKTTSISLNCDQIKVYSNPDILICGNCREMYTDLQDLLEHKKTYCKLRFTCKCHTYDPVEANGNSHSEATLQCVQCKDSFLNAWDLMVHAQAAHTLNIYTLGVPNNGTSEPEGHSDQEENGSTETNGDHEGNGVMSVNGDSEDHDLMDLATNGTSENENDNENGKSTSSCGSLPASPHSNLHNGKVNGNTNSMESSITNSFDAEFDVSSEQH